MKINYKVFSKHAEKVAKSGGTKRPILKGIEHRNDGTLTVTDTHRLYRAYNVNGPKDVILDAVSGEEIDAGGYPDTDKIIPEQSQVKATLLADVKKLKEVLKAMQVAGRVNGTKKDRQTVCISDKQITLDNDAGVTFSYELGGANPEDVEVCLNLNYILESIEMLDDMKAGEVVIRLFGSEHPLAITPQSSANIQALILPIKNI